MSLFDPRTWFRSTKPPKPEKHKESTDDTSKTVSPGRVSVPDDTYDNLVLSLNGMTKLVTPSFRTDLIPIIRDLYKVNPDVSIAVQDMFKLSNTGHSISFPYNTAEEAKKMRKHLKEAADRWGRYTGGIDGLVNKLAVQALVSGAISIEAVPNMKLDGVETILFIKPETILFKRESNGVYHPYQRNPHSINNNKPEYIKLNTSTYKYSGLYNDLDEPYGIPPFLAALDSLKGQHDMRINFKHIMEIMGMVGFLEAKIEKPSRRSSESEASYQERLNTLLKQLKFNLIDGMKDGVVTGFMDEHEFELNSTTQNLSNIEKPWNMNQQSVANGLGVNSSIIGVQSQSTEGGAGIQLSKMIAQLGNLQKLLSNVLEFMYSLELRLAGFNHKGIEIVFNTSTISDEVKVQQGQEYKIRNLTALYNQGIISQDEFAFRMGYSKADKKEPRIPLEDPSSNSVSSPDQNAKKQKREADKDKSDRRVRDKENPSPKRSDQDTRPR